MDLYIATLVLLFGVLIGLGTWLVSLPFLTVSGYRAFFGVLFRPSQGMERLAGAVAGCFAFSLVWGVVYASLLAVVFWALIAFGQSNMSPVLLWGPHVALPASLGVGTLLVIRWLHMRWDSLRPWTFQNVRTSGAFIAVELIKLIGLTVVNVVSFIVLSLAIGPSP